MLQLHFTQPASRRANTFAALAMLLCSQAIAPVPRAGAQRPQDVRGELPRAS